MVVGCVVASRVTRYHLRTVYSARCVVAAKQSVLCVDLFHSRLRKFGKMNHRRCNEPDAESSDSESSGSSSDFHGDNLPSPDVLRKTPMRVWTNRIAQTEPGGNVVM